MSFVSSAPLFFLVCELSIVSLTVIRSWCTQGDQILGPAARGVFKCVGFLRWRELCDHGRICVSKIPQCVRKHSCGSIFSGLFAMVLAKPDHADEGRRATSGRSPVSPSVEPENQPTRQGADHANFDPCLPGHELCVQCRLPSASIDSRGNQAVSICLKCRSSIVRVWNDG